ncbi:MAG: nitrile hydratase subunit beta, partial [Aestuariivirgaceae bacterium]
GEHMVALENTPDVHNMVVCTLCSCYPWPVLSLPPAQYLSLTYYQIWFAALSNLLAELAFVTQAEIDEGKRLNDPRDLPRGAVTADEVPAILARGGPASRPETKPARFKVGDEVTTRNINPETHTRLARYLRGRTGEIAMVHGVHVLPDSSAHGKGDDAQWLYSVRFSARELWGEDYNAKDHVHADLWETYFV